MHDVNDFQRRLNGRTRTALAHGLVWGCYIALELYVLAAYTPHLEAPWVYVVFYSLNIALFYGTLWGLRAGGRRLLDLAGRCLLVFGTYLAAKSLADRLLYQHTAAFSSWPNLRHFIASAFLRGYLFIFPAVFYRLAGFAAAYKRQALEAEKREADSRNAYLQQQLNPHLLFNTLNFVYSQVFRSSVEAAQAVQWLTEILRYTVQEPDDDGKVTLDLELEQLHHLTEINRLRFGEAMQLQVRIGGMTGQPRIIPLVLLTLTENIFKHGDLRDPDRPALLEIGLREGPELIYHSRNLKKHQSGRPRLKSIGLRNTRLRLDHAYPGRHELLVREDTEHFELTLTIRL